MPVSQASQTSVPGATLKEKGVSSMSTLWMSRFVKNILPILFLGGGGGQAKPGIVFVSRQMGL